ncbi:MAG: hypothetical protein H0W76_19245 [Pyrinomonadaceae bacterium]|nr:hypothetical protein [Pyrinomonadaceae bacterium]
MKKQALRVIALLSLFLTLAMAPAHAQDRERNERLVNAFLSAAPSPQTSSVKTLH